MNTFGNGHAPANGDDSTYSMVQGAGQGYDLGLGGENWAGAGNDSKGIVVGSYGDGPGDGETTGGVQVSFEGLDEDEDDEDEYDEDPEEVIREFGRHPMMDRVQEALYNQLLQTYERVSEELKDKNAEVKK